MDKFEEITAKRKRDTQVRCPEIRGVSRFLEMERAAYAMARCPRSTKS